MARSLRAGGTTRRELRSDAWWTRLALILGLVAGLVASCTGSGRADAAHPSFDPNSLAPVDGALLGAWEPPASDWSEPGQQAAVDDLEAKMGHTLAIDHHYYRFTVPFPTWRETWDVQNGRIPLISWARASDADVISGADDGLIRQRADAVRDLGAPVFIRWSWEMDSPAVRSIVGTPDQYVAAWRHIHDLFAREGATNVRWVWCPNAWAFDLGTGSAYYPGDDYVDWTCADAYNWSPARPGGTSGGKWTQFAQLFQSFYSWASQHDKPIMVGETGAQESAQDGLKAAWIDAIRTDVEQRFPAIKALVYFDAVGGSFSGGSFDWRVDTSDSSLAAFIGLARDPYFQGEPSDPGPLPTPTDLTVTASGTSVTVAWVPAPGSSGTTVYRNGVAIGAPVAGASYRDNARLAGRTYRYTVAAVDGTGRTSPATAPAVVTVPYSLWDGFETGSLGKWRPVGAVTVHRGTASTGSYAVVATSTGRPASAARSVPALASGVDFDVDFRVASQGPGSVLLQVLRTPSGTPLLGMKRRGDGRLALYDYATGIGRIAPGWVRLGAWHHLTLSVDLAGAGSFVVVTLDGRQVAPLTGAHPLTGAAIGSVQVGDDRPGRAFDVAFDDVEVQTPA